MKTELRVIQASFLAGATDLVVGLFMHFTNLHEWWFEQFHLFGVLGVGFLAYASWHTYLYKRDTGKTIWKKEKKK